MKNNIKKILITLSSTLAAVLLVTTITYAVGTLTPSGTPGEATQYTLNDIYTKLTTNNSTSTKSGLFTAPDPVVASFSTLTDIYDAIPTIDATKVATGTSYLGVAGTLRTELEWSIATTTATFVNAQTFCADLVEGSSDWRLPTISELLAAISDDWIIDGGASPRFAYVTGYWSGTEKSDGSNAWYAYWNDYVGYGYGSKTYPYSVRCVR